jgi:hypothetical protein
MAMTVKSAFCYMAPFCRIKFTLFSDQSSAIIQNRYVSGFCPSSGIPKELENKTYRKLDRFPSSGEGRETLTLLSPFGKS